MSSRAFGFCYAESAKTPRGAIYASLNNEDSMSGGESLYIAELRRARELLEACKAVDGGVCLIDEIFQGTNHVEAVAAAGAFLHALAPNAMVVASSHHTVLAALLAKAYSPLCLSTSADVPASLTLQAGVLSEPNGISLLRTQGFDADVDENARRIAAWFAGFLSHPKPAGGLLKP